MKLFLPQKTLEEWALAERADLQDGQLLLKETKSTHPIVAAVHFQKLVSGEDAHGLLGRVKTKEQLDSLSAEQFAESCIIGDAAYEVVDGFVTEVVVAAPVKADPRKKAVASPEADLLAAFILDKL